MDKTKQILADYAARIDAILQDIMNIEENAIADTLISAMKYSLFSGGKRLRPILTILVAELLEGELDSAGKAGAAIELIHTYSLIHDDLPSMDNDDYRRGKLTNHKVYGTGIAILAGDSLLTYAFHLLSQLKIPAERIVKLVGLISEGAGYNGIVGGQVLDLEAENREIGLESLQEIHLAKTAALFRSAILAGAFCAEPTEKELAALARFSEHFGLTFQIVDDLLDVIGDEQKLGKKTGSDKVLNKATYPQLLGINGARASAEKSAALAKESLEIFGSKAAILNDLVDYIIKRQS